ncbi:MAG: ribokinase [Jatrophihabitans sp.]
MNRVLVVGSMNVDLSASVSHLPAAGETILGAGSEPMTGGKGANQAIAAGRLGADVAMVAAAGTDAFGDQACAALAAAGVDISGIRRIDGAVTGLALITVAAGGENTIVVCSGANDLLDPETATAAGQTASAGDVMLLQLEVPLGTALAAASAASARGAIVILNAAPLPALRDDSFDDLLRACQVLVVNEVEALALAGCPAPETTAEWIDLAGVLCATGPATCVITLGANGAVAASADTGSHQPAFPVDSVDTTGAGDSFCATLGAGLAAGFDLPTALRRACAAGALSTTALGAQSALPTDADLDALLSAEQVG